MSSATKKSKSAVYWINTAIVVFCYFGFGLLPEMFGLSYAGMRTIGIFLGLLWGWITTEFAWVSLLGIIAMGTVGVMTPAEAFNDAFMSSTFFMLLMPMILMAFLAECGFSDWLAYKLLALPFLKGHPWKMVTMIFLVANILCFAVTLFPMILLMWSIMVGIGEVAGYQKKDKFMGYMMSGIVMQSSIIGTSVPWAFTTLTIQSLIAESLNGAPYPFVPILVLGIVGALVAMIVTVLIGKFILRVDVSKLQELSPEFYEKAASLKLHKKGKVGVVVLCLFIVCMSIPSLFPDFPFASFLSSLGIQGVAILILALLLLLRDKEGKPFATTDQLAKAGISWDILFLVVSTISLTTLMKDPNVGILEKVTSTLVPILTSVNPSLFLVATIVVFWILTQVTHNIIIILTLVGAMSGVCVQIGINPWLFAWAFMCAMNFAFCTPAASSPGAMFYANEWVARKDAYICGIAYSVSNLIVFLIVMLPLAKIMFG